MFLNSVDVESSNNYLVWLFTMLERSFLLARFVSENAQFTGFLAAATAHRRRKMNRFCCSLSKKNKNYKATPSRCPQIRNGRARDQWMNMTRPKHVPKLSFSIFDSIFPLTRQNISPKRSQLHKKGKRTTGRQGQPEKTKQIKKALNNERQGGRNNDK